MTRRLMLALAALTLLAACSIDSHDSRLDNCLKGHDEYHHDSGGGVVFICDQYDLPLKKAP